MQALLWRQWLLKSRAWASTAAEVISPVLLVGMLLLAYGLVHPDYYAPRVCGWLARRLLRRFGRACFDACHA